MAFDRILTRAIFPKEAPQTWGEWPAEAVEVWSRGGDIFAAMSKECQIKGAGPGRDLTLKFSWDIVLEFSVNPDEWWLLPGVTWAQVGDRMGLSPRRAAYRMMVLGWSMRGSGMGVPNRRVVTAPCEGCGRVWEPKEIVDRLGPLCTGDDGC